MLNFMLKMLNLNKPYNKRKFCNPINLITMHLCRQTCTPSTNTLWFNVCLKKRNQFGGMNHFQQPQAQPQAQPHFQQQQSKKKKKIV